MNRRLWIGNLPFDCTSSELKLTAQRFGNIEWARISVFHDRPGEPSKGYAFVECQSIRDAELVKNGLSHTSLGGRCPLVEFSQPSGTYLRTSP